MFKINSVRNIFEKFVDRINDTTFEKLQYIGEEFINKARLSGNYTDRTGNLRSSIGYIILKDGQAIHSNFEGEEYEGREKGMEFASEIAVQYPNGWVLIGVAGMEYAASVEAHGFDVITGSAPTQQMLKSIISEINT